MTPPTTALDLSDQTILVTGSSRGIGAAIGLRLAGAGARVAVHYVADAAGAGAVVAASGGKASAFQADLTDPAACLGLWRAVEARYGRISGLVNNAGIAVAAPIETSDAAWMDAWDKTMAVNLRAVGLLSRAAVAHFERCGGGRIVTVASRAAFRGDQPAYLAYAASKAGVVALTRSIARAYGKSGVRAFILAPGFTRTDMAQDFIDRYGEDFALNDIALERLTEPDDIAPTAVFLMSGLADHATGATIDLNAGSYMR